MPHPHACEDAAVLPIPADSISPRPTIRSMHVPASSLNHRQAVMPQAQVPACRFASSDGRLFAVRLGLALSRGQAENDTIEETPCRSWMRLPRS